MTANHFEAGAASAIVNPPVGSFIAGDKLNRRFTGVHDDLRAKALVIGNGQEYTVFLSVDCLGLTRPDIRKVRAKTLELLPPEVQIDAGRILVGSTHIHNGPDIIGIYGPDERTSGLDPEYMDFLIRTCAQTIADAVGRRVPVRAWHAATRHGASWVRNICEPEVLDDTVAVLQFTDLEERTVATLTNFACHPTILDGVHDMVSADWVGGMYRGLADALEGEHLFFQGAIGAWVQPDKGDRSFRLAEELGRGVAAAVSAALAERRPVKGNRLQVLHESLTIPLANEGWARLAAAGIVDRELKDVVETDVTALTIGDVSLVTHPGETPPGYGLEARESLETQTPLFVLGLTQDALGYLLPPAYFDPDTPIPHARYLTRMSVGPEAGDQVRTACRRLLAALTKGT